MRLGYALIYVEDVPKTLAFYVRALGCTIGFMDESQQYGECLTGDTKLGFVQHDTAGSHGFVYTKMNRHDPPPGLEIGFISDDVEASFRHAVNAGAEPVLEPKKKPWGQTVSYIRDCNGLLVEICSPMP
ncbi:VOC family protein [bacterium]|nr:VOC family protein [bacterium]